MKPLMEPLLLALGLCLTTNVAYEAANASPLPAVSDGPYAKPPRPGSSKPRYHVALLLGAKPEPTTGTMIMRAVGRGNVPALIRRPLFRRWHPYLPTPPELRHYHLPPLPGYNFADPLAVNHHRQVVGYYGGGGSGAYLVVLAKAFVWQNGRLHFLPTLPEYTITHAVAINNHGLVAGDASLGSFPGDENVPAHAVCWVHFKIRDLGTGAALAVNNAGAIVGDSGNGPAVSYHDPHALLWTHGYRYDLNDCLPPRSGWVLSTATGITNNGQITGYGLFHGKEQAFVLTPLRNTEKR
jgi:hypothetical protein